MSADASPRQHSAAFAPPATGGALAATTWPWRDRLLGAAFALLVAALALGASHAALQALGVRHARAGPLEALAGALGLVVGGLGWWAVTRRFAAARTREQRLGEMLRIAADWTWEMTPKGRLTWLSPSFEARTGRSIDEFLQLGEPGGPTLVDDAASRAFRAALRAHEPFRDMVLNFICADGVRLSVKGSGEPVFDAAGTLIGWWGSSHDATFEMQAQRELQRSRAILERLFRQSPDAISVASLRDGRLLMVNAGFERQSGLSEREAIGRNAVELGLWRDLSEPTRLRDALADGGVVRDLRSEAWTASGERRQLLLSAGSFEWDGEPVAVIISRDITEIEQHWQDGEAILNNASVGIALVRAQRFERVNPRFEAIFGAPAGSLRGQPADLLFPPMENRDAFVAASERAQAAGETIEIERSIVLADGSERVAHLRGRSVDPARPLEAGSIWVVEDITEARLAAAELKEAQRLAEAASVAKSAFLASMSHEIRTPLNGVLGLTRLLQAPSLDEARRREYLRHLGDSAELLAGIVSDVLDLSKIEAGRVHIEQVGFDLHKLLESSFGTFAPLGRERGLAMRLAVAPEVPQRVLGDPVRLRQIVSNFLANALKFTARGSIELAATPRGEGVRIEVRDTGIGIGEAAQQRLFEPFTQADGSTTRRFGGTGLGLSICRQLAALMQGSVGVASREGAGSSFWVDLPLRASTADTGLGPLDEPPRQRPLAGRRVLVAEDNPVNMLIAVALLENLGAEVLRAEDGVRAVAIARDHADMLDAVLMDLHMPEMDGLRAARLLTEDPHTAGIPLVAVSAAVLDAERAEARDAGMVEFIAKPVSEAELLRVLLELRRR